MKHFYHTIEYIFVSETVLKIHRRTLSDNLIHDKTSLAKNIKTNVDRRR